MAKKDNLDKLTKILVIVGALVWGLVIFDYNIIESIATAINMDWVSTVVYSLVGLSGLYQAYKLIK